MSFINFKGLTVADSAIASLYYNQSTNKVEITTKDAKVFCLQESLEEAKELISTPAVKEIKQETRLWLSKGAGIEALNMFLGVLASLNCPVVTVTSDASNRDRLWWTVLYRATNKVEGTE